MYSPPHILGVPHLQESVLEEGNAALEAREHIVAKVEPLLRGMGWNEMT